MNDKVEMALEFGAVVRKYCLQKPAHVAVDCSCSQLIEARAVAGADDADGTKSHVNIELGD